MKRFLKNSFVDISAKGDSHIIDIFSGASGEKRITVQGKSHLAYLIVAKSSQLDLHVDMQGQDSVCQIFAIFVSDTAHVNAKILTYITSSSVKAETYVVSLLGEYGKISVDADIDIKKGIRDVVAHLLEENIVFGKNISIKSLPALSVASHDVQASHGAKIEKINQDKLFYMQSKGLSSNEAQKLVIDGYVNMILSHFEQFPEKELAVVRSFVAFDAIKKLKY
ncbi:MAG: hypothetical protein CO170_03250 [candidate division SR1 bacterium CG_4_9_14_3_um_filter_40_9]|nr:MAG: hypothetical protein CO170_03250 [candidate division SR1 bacterium CG_4_9_14_3_um_filter_40_9]